MSDNVFLGRQHNLAVCENQLLTCADVNDLPDEDQAVISVFNGFKKDNYDFLIERCFQTRVKEVCGPPSMSVQALLLLIFGCY